MKLGADMNQIRQQVIQLLPGSRGQEVTDEDSRLGEQARARLRDDPLARVDALERRLAAIGRWVRIRPDLDALDQEIAQVRREKKAAIDRQDFGASAALQDREKQLLAARASHRHRRRAPLDRPAGLPPAD